MSRVCQRGGVRVYRRVADADIRSAGARERSGHGLGLGGDLRQISAATKDVVRRRSQSRRAQRVLLGGRYETSVAHGKSASEDNDLGEHFDDGFARFVD